MHFDENNPRFTPEKNPLENSDLAIITYLAETADLSELVQSISASGYIDIEPLIVEGRGDRLVVLEGNRRLAALKLLSNPDLARAAKISLPDLAPGIANTLKAVTIYRVEDQAEARDLIGFKHINGPKAWDAYAKGRYAAHWLDIETEKKQKGMPGLSLTDIAKRMGDKHDTIYRIVTAVYVLDQAIKANAFRVEDRVQKNFNFSHLYTALTYPEFRDFIGMLALDRSADPLRSPIPAEKLSSLGQLLRWLFGSKTEEFEPAIKRQNPDLSRLKRVLAEPRSRRIMMERNNLDEAIESTVTSSERFEKNLVDADASLTSAQAALDGYDGRDKTLLDIAESVRNKSNVIYRTMQITRQEVEEETLK